MPKYIDENELYRASDDGRRIFEHYFQGHDFNNHRIFVKCRADEKTASAKISYYQGKWRITDFGDSDTTGLTGVAFVMQREKLPYYDALRFIEEVILRLSATDDGKFKRSAWTAIYEFREPQPDDVPAKYLFSFKEPSQSDLSTIGPFVKKEHLEDYNCKVIDKYEVMGFSKKMNRDVVHVWRSTDDYPIFLFDYGVFQKLYQPHSQDKKYRFQYIGTKPKDYVYGLSQILRDRNEFTGDDGNVFLPTDKPDAIVRDLFRVSGESDALNMASLGFHVYWLNSESAGYSGKYREIDELCENHYQILDLDPTGQAMARKNALEHINMYTMTLPEWLSIKKDFRGNPCKDIKDFIAQFKTPDEALSSVRIRKAKSRKIKFWHKDPEKGTYNLNMEHYFHFLNINGFYIFRYGHIKNTDYCYVHIRENVVNIITPDQIKRKIKRLTKEWVMSKNLVDEIAILNKLNTSAQISESTVDCIGEIELDFKNCSKDVEYMHFKNCSLKITTDKIEKVKHTDVPNFILGDMTVKGKRLSQITDFNLSFQPDNEIEIKSRGKFAELLEKRKSTINAHETMLINSEIDSIPEAEKYEVVIKEKPLFFAEFIRDLSRLYWRKEIEDGQSLTKEEQDKEILNLVNIMYALGYLSAQHKNQAKAWLVYLQDTKESAIGESSGRSGKSLLTKALTYVRNSFYIGGRELADQSRYQFLYDGFTEFHDIIEVDDLSEHANFDFFYTQITGNRIINSKNTSPFVLEYEDSGKMIMSTNFEMPNSSASTVARMLNVGVSDFYHQKTTDNDYNETRSPYDVYGKMMFTDFTNDEWNRFYYFMAYCIQLYMRYPRIKPPMESLERRQMRKVMSSGLGRGDLFLEWANDFFLPWTGEALDKPEFSTTTDDDTRSDVYFDTLFSKKAAFEHFRKNAGIPDNKLRNISTTAFQKKLYEWCRYMGYDLNPEAMCTDKARRRIRRRIGIGDNLSEFYYVRKHTEVVIKESLVPDRTTSDSQYTALTDPLTKPF